MISSQENLQFRKITHYTVHRCVFDVVKFTGNLHLSVTREDSSDIDINSYVLEWTSKSILMCTYCKIVEITHVMDTGYHYYGI